MRCELRASLAAVARAPESGDGLGPPEDLLDASRDEKQRFYRMARRSATETAAILDILDRRKAVAASVLTPALELLERVVAMLARLAGA